MIHNQWQLKLNGLLFAVDDICQNILPILIYTAVKANSFFQSAPDIADPARDVPPKASDVALLLGRSSRSFNRHKGNQRLSPSLRLGAIKPTGMFDQVLRRHAGVYAHAGCRL